MTAGAHDAGGGFSRSAGTNAARGVLVIIAAVAVGLLLMFRGIGDSSNDTAADATPAADGGGDTSDAAAAGDTSTTVPTGDTVVESTTTTVSAPPRDPSEVKVLVLNGTDATSRVAGVAGAGTDLLKPSNYITLEPKDADINGPSAVFHRGVPGRGQRRGRCLRRRPRHGRAAARSDRFSHRRHPGSQHRRAHRVRRRDQGLTVRALSVEQVTVPKPRSSLPSTSSEARRPPPS
ncbi:MAG: hypothetical protein R2710_23905 [Acidimicrobiales bacterium]